MDFFHNKINSFFPDTNNADTQHENLFSKKRIFNFIISFIQLSGLFLILNKLNIENESGINQVSFIILGFFILNSFIPKRFRPAILVSISFTIIYYAFGFFSGSLMIFTGLAIILCCHLPINIWYRASIIILITIGLIILRSNLFHAPRAAIIVPYIASLFMFRVIIYLYELKNNKDLTSTFWQKLSYFFLFPNLFFLLFPIIDFKLFVKSYNNRKDSDLWQKGIRWILRGVIHLIGYRIVYYNILISPDEITNLSSLLIYIISNYILILRLSGMFHLIIGLLCLFGFNLHPIFNNYFLATSFVDMWRRINIYWHEFIMKIFFYPLIFMLRKKSSTYVLPISMLLVFIITWALHNYQWYWIRGYFPIKSTDIAFWLIVGICVTINSVWDAKKTKKLKKNKTLLSYPIKMLKITSLFLFMSVLWSIWNSVSFNQWFYIISKSSQFTLTEIFLILSIIVGVIIIGSLFQVLIKANKIALLLSIPPEKTLLLTFPTIFLLLSFSTPEINQYTPSTVSTYINAISMPHLNKIDKTKLEIGYYEKLIDGDDKTIKGLWKTKLKRPKTFTPIDDIAIRTTDLLTRKLKPNKEIRVNNYLLKTNSFGMRDKEYSLSKPENTYRMVLLGGSYEMGSGVEKNKTFEYLVEKKMNENSTNEKYEILNFAIGGYHLIQQVELANTKVFNFEPDALIYVAHTDEKRRLLGFFANLIQNETDLKYPFLKKIKTLSKVNQTMSKVEIKDRLSPFIDSIIQWGYLQIANSSKKNNSKPIWLFLPATADEFSLEEFNKIKSFALNVGFEILDLRGVYGNIDREIITISEWDSHPNEKGHQIIADKLFEKIMLNSEKLQLTQ
jgi:D-alanyl-lipoteichoic acid acyltransferase DltB (MBOAT superfamily)